MKLNDVIKDCITLKLDGRATDGAIQVFGGNFLSEQKPVLPIEVRDKETLLWMMQGADDVHIYVASGVFHFNALYKPADRFPAARIYYLKTENLLALGSVGVFLERNGLTLKPINDAGFSKLIDDLDYPRTERSGFHPMASVWCAEQKQIGCQRLRYREAQVC